jgi:hypothetical protein
VALVRDQEGWALINQNFNIQRRFPRGHEIEYCGFGMYAYDSGQGKYLLDFNAETVGGPYSEIGEVSNALCAVRDGLWGIVNHRGVTIAESQWSKASVFGDMALMYSEDNLYFASYAGTVCEVGKYLKHRWCGADKFAAYDGSEWHVYVCIDVPRVAAICEDVYWDSEGSGLYVKRRGKWVDFNNRNSDVSVMWDEPPAFRFGWWCRQVSESGVYRYVRRDGAVNPELYDYAKPYVAGLGAAREKTTGEWVVLDGDGNVVFRAGNEVGVVCGYICESDGKEATIKIYQLSNSEYQVLPVRGVGVLSDEYILVGEASWLSPTGETVGVYDVFRKQMVVPCKYPGMRYWSNDMISFALSKGFVVVDVVTGRVSRKYEYIDRFYSERDPKPVWKY